MTLPSGCFFLSNTDTSITREIFVMSKEIKSVIIYSRINDESVVFTLIDLVNFLVEQKINVIIEQSTNDKLRLSMPTLKFADMKDQADLMIIVGGDGSMISAGRKIAMVGVPVLGINRGHLGFLTDLAPKDIRKALYSILKGEYVLEERFLLSTTIKGPKCQHALALNEAVIHGVKTAHMIDFSIFVKIGRAHV